MLVAVTVTAAACGSTSGPVSPGPTATQTETPTGSPTGSPTRGALPGTTVPGTQLTGAGAFEGPVRQVPVNGIKIGYRQFGTGPDLVMVLGYTAAMSLWTVDLLSGLARHFRVTIFDNRGVGYTTDNLSQPITVPLMAQDTVGLIQVLGQRSPILLGWSMGGEIGLTVAALHPGVLAKLVTSGANPGSSQSVQTSPEVIHELNDPATTPEQLLDLLFPPTAEAAKARFSQQYLLVPQEKVSALTIKRQGAAVTGFAEDSGTWNALPGVAIPVLVTNGTEDVIVPPANAAVIKRGIKDARVELFAGAGHAMFFQDTDRFVALVAGFSG